MTSLLVSVVGVLNCHVSEWMVVGKVGRSIQVIDIRRAILLYEFGLVSEIIANHELVTAKFLSHIPIVIALLV